MKSLFTRQGGVSLLEALVALAVMAFGMMGIVGMQSALRQSADGSRHRSESMRIAQESIERARAYSVVGTVSAPKLGFDDLVDLPIADVTDFATNVTYRRALTVVDQPRASLLPAAATSVPGLLDVATLKSVRVDITWTDRSGISLSNRLSAVIHRSPPELAGSLAISGAGTAAELPRGRHYTIPESALDQGDGTSSFSPPGSTPDVHWIFNNASGLITQVCSTANGGCITVTAMSLHGLVLFATDSSQPSSGQAEDPASNAFNVSAGITLTSPSIGSAPTGVPAPECFTEQAPPLPATTRRLEYFCLVYVLPGSPQWSGRALLSGTSLASRTTDNTFRVCRYTRVRNDDSVGSGIPPLTNPDHPRDYSGVAQSLINQNFLIIRSPFDCPDDNSLTPFVNGGTWLHQPSS